MDPIDPDLLLMQCAGDPQVVQEVLSLFRGALDAQLRELRRAVASRDSHATLEAAHRLNGELLTLAAQPAAGLAQQIERAGASADVAGAEAVLGALEREVERVVAAMNAMEKSAAPGQTD